MMNEHQNERLEAALKYQTLGWSIIPTEWRTGKDPRTGEDREKKPLVKWKKYQSQRASPDQIRKWWARWPEANVGVVTGEISGILVVDIESEKGHQAYRNEFGELPRTISQSTGKPKGMHLFFRHPMDGKRYRTLTKVRNDIDVRGEGGYVIVAPSIHPNGSKYRWIIGPLGMH